MNYQEAFNRIIDIYGLEVLNNTFLVHSFLSDYTKSNEDIELLNAYFILNRKEPIYETIKHYSLNDSKHHIKSLIIESDRQYTPVQYIKSIEPLLFILYPNEYVRVQDNFQKKNVVNNIVKIKANNNNNNQNPIVQNKAINKKKAFSSFNIFSDCKKLTIKSEACVNFRVINKRGKDVTNKVHFDIKNDVFDLVLQEKNEEFTVNIPPKTYKTFAINHGNGDLSIQMDLPSKKIAKELFIYCDHVYSNIECNADKIHI